MATATKKTYTLRDGFGGEKKIRTRCVEKAAHAWIAGCDYVPEPVDITNGTRYEEARVRVEVEDVEGCTTYITVVIPPKEPACKVRGLKDGDHVLKANPNDGCRENPGVWSLGGTAHSSLEYCLRCGRSRCETTLGSQRNEGEGDYVVWDDAADRELIDSLRAHYGYESK